MFVVSDPDKCQSCYRDFSSFSSDPYRAAWKVSKMESSERADSSKIVMKTSHQQNEIIPNNHKSYHVDICQNNHNRIDVIPSHKGVLNLKHVRQLPHQ